MSYHNDYILILSIDGAPTAKQIIPEQLVDNGHITPMILASYAHSMEAPYRRFFGSVPADREWYVRRAHE